MLKFPNNHTRGKDRNGGLKMLVLGWITIQIITKIEKKETKTIKWEVILDTGQKSIRAHLYNKKIPLIK